MHQVIANKIYTVKKELYIPGNAEDKTAVFNLSDDPHLVERGDNSQLICSWPMEDDVDEMSFAAVVRMCATIIRGSGQSVLIIGHQDTVDVFSSCIIMEYLGCTSEVALDVVRENRPNCMTKSELIETVFKYKIS